jgi:murein DD-endopeptidase MepM/ murein hydrolase activator NlpD
VDVDRWPEEPAVPAQIIPERFREAVSYLCRKPVEQTPAYEILAGARETGVDPFLLAALMSERSRCRPKLQTRGGFGLLLLQPSMYLKPGAPELPVHDDEWRPANLLSARANVSLAARLMRMWQEQHHALDLAFGGVAHRSAVSHFFWGDQVDSSGSEDMVLTARRRLLKRYLGHVEEPRLSDLGVAVVPPLEAAPRVATSGPGDDRDRGARSHRGLDLVATPGEPIRAVADGRVIFAGVNLINNTRYGPIPPSRIGRYTNQNLGRGGIYLCIRHVPNDPEKPQRVVTCYMHLERYFVGTGEQVTAGQTIGLVGRSGIKRSPPHLHFEVRVDNRFEDPARLFTESVIPPVDTLTYRYTLRAKRARAARARAMRQIPTATINLSPKS